MIDFNNVSVKYRNDDRFCILKDLELHIEDGAFVFIVGKSGAGKSTLIRSLLRETDVTSGSIVVDGEDISGIKNSKLPYYRRKVGVVFQDYKLIDTKTVYENVAFAMQAVRANKKDIQARVTEVLRMVGLLEYADKFPNTLSGGEQQRVAIARAIANKPKILICDEPTGNLDEITGNEIMDILLSVNEEGTTVIIATHDTETVNRLKKRVIVIKHGEMIDDIRNGEYKADEYDSDIF
ncbi:MAG: cell division ATP-binding protein FtsE [Anaerofustis stercorihominis]|nr:cell division ATP-binding protein FtsE [Anaerofustis stercorihominis]